MPANKPKKAQATPPKYLPNPRASKSPPNRKTIPTTKKANIAPATAPIATFTVHLRYVFTDARILSHSDSGSEVSGTSTTLSDLN